MGGGSDEDEDEDEDEDDDGALKQAKLPLVGARFSWCRGVLRVAGLVVPYTIEATVGWCKGGPPTSGGALTDV